MQRILVTGLGAVTPIGIGWRDFWASVLQQRNGFAEVSSFDTSKFKVTNMRGIKRSATRTTAPGSSPTPDADTDTDTDTDTDAGTDAGAGTDADTGAGTSAATDTGIGAGTRVRSAW